MSDSPVKIPFKVFGLQRTGTNLMVALLKKNFLVQSLEIGAEWKHGPVLDPDRQWNNTAARFVLCVKNPYAWLVSCFRYFRSALGADSTIPVQFARRPRMSFGEFVVASSYEFTTPVHRWNQMYRLWLETLPESRTFVVRHEDQLEDQIEVLMQAQRKLGLTPLGRLNAIACRVDVNEALGLAMNSTYYLRREYMQEYSSDLVARVNEMLDRETMERFNYAMQWE